MSRMVGSRKKGTEEGAQSVLTRLMPEKYSSVDEILSADGYVTTVCVLERNYYWESDMVLVFD